MDRIKVVWKFIRSDLYRTAGNVSLKFLLRHLYSDPGFKFLFFFRICKVFNRKNLIGMVSYLFYKRYSIKYGFQIPLTVNLGYGIALPHFGNIVINSNSKIGSNCNILHGVTLGNNRHGKSMGSPTVGNNVFLGPGSAIIGGISIGDNTLIAANSYVNSDIPKDSIVLGNPCKIISSLRPSSPHMINQISVEFYLFLILLNCFQL